MKHIIINFNNRTALYTFAKILNNYQIYSSIINTPRSISKSCSLSLKINFNYLNNLINIIKTSNFNHISGVFVLEKQGINERIQRLY